MWIKLININKRLEFNKIFYKREIKINLEIKQSVS